MEGAAVRVESTPTRRRAWWPPLRRRRDIAITLRLRSVEHLFTAPDADPFDPDYERYPDKPGVDAIAGVLHVERPVASVRALIELPEHWGREHDTLNVAVNTRTIRASGFGYWFTNGNNYHI